jgi:chorismate mutase
MIKEVNAHKDLEKLHIQTIEALRAKIDNIDKEVIYSARSRLYFPIFSFF